MTDLRESLKKGFVVKAKNIDGYEFEILDEFARGGSSVIYTACGRDGMVLIKELFPVNGYCRTNGRICSVNSQYRDLSESALRMNGEHNIGEILTLKSAWVEKIGNPFESSDGNYYSVIHESRPGVTMKQILSSDETDNISLRAWVEMIHRLAWIVKDLHDEKIVHLDISPGNIRLINNNDEETLIKAVASHDGSSATLQYGVTLIDFGCSLELNSFNEAVKPFYSPTTGGYSAPELYIDGSGIVTPTADVFSVCACLKSCISKINRENYSDLPITVTTKLDEILERGLAEDPMYRFKNIDSLIKELSELLLLIDGKGINKTVIWEASKRDYAKKLHTRFKDSKSEDIIDEIWSYAKCSIDKGKYGKLNIRQIMSKYKDKNCLIVGDGGMGKTTLLISLLHDIFSNDKKYDSEKAVPVFVELNKAPDDIDAFAKKGDKESSFILRYIAGLLFNVDYTEVSDETLVALRKEFTKSVERPEYIFLLDGLNEASSRWINEVSNSVQGIIAEEINDIVKNFNNVRFLVTTRDDNNGVDNRCFELISLNGLSKEKVLDWIKSHNITENIEDLKNNTALLECLKTPLFLLMYSKIKPFNNDISSQGELLRAFWNEKSHSYSQYRVAQNKNAGAVRRDMSVEQHRFIVNFIIPEMCYCMLLEQDFEINNETAKEQIRDILAKFASESSKYKALQRAFKSYNVSKGKYRHDIIDVIRSFDKFEDCEMRILVEIENIGVFDSIERNSDILYEARHQYFRDYFAAVHIINGLRVAAELFECNEKDDAFNFVEKLFNVDSRDKNVSRLIGEYLGEHKNRPYYEDGEWHYGVPSEKCDRNLIERVLDIYRSINCSRSYLGASSLVTVIRDSRKDLSGVDLSYLDLMDCRLNGYNFSKGNLIAKFYGSKLFSNVFFSQKHSSPLLCALYLLSDLYVVTIGTDNYIKLWNMNTLYNMYTFTSENISETKFSIIQNGNSVAYGQNQVKIEGEIGVQFNLMKNNRIKYGMDGKFAAKISDKKDIILYEGHNFMTTKTILKGHDSGIILINFNHDGSRLVSVAKGGKAIIWDTEKGTSLFSIGNQKRRIDFASFSHDGTKLLTVCNDKRRVRIWDLSNRKIKHSLPVQPKQIKAVMYSNSEKYIVTVLSNNTVEIRNGKSYGFIGNIKNEEDLISVTFDASDTTLMIVDRQGTGKFYDMTTFEKSEFSFCSLIGIKDISYCPEKHLLATASWDGTIKIWDTDELRCIHILTDPFVKSVVYSSDFKYLFILSDNDELKICDATTLEVKKRISQVKDFSYNSEVNRILTCYKKEIRLWNADSFEQIDSLILDKGHPVLSIQFNPDGKTFLATSYNNVVKIMDGSFKKVGVLFGHMSKVLSACFSPDGQYIATSSEDRTIKIWSRTDKKYVCIHSIYEKAKMVRFSENGKYLYAVTSGTNIKIWDTEKFECVHPFKKLEKARNVIISDTDVDTAFFADRSGVIHIKRVQDSKEEELLYNIPGLFINNVNFRNLHSDTDFNETQKKILIQYGAILDE